MILEKQLTTLFSYGFSSLVGPNFLSTSTNLVFSLRLLANVHSYDFRIPNLQVVEDHFEVLSCVHLFLLAKYHDVLPRHPKIAEAAATGMSMEDGVLYAWRVGCVANLVSGFIATMRRSQKCGGGGGFHIVMGLPQ